MEIIAGLCVIVGLALFTLWNFWKAIQFRANAIRALQERERTLAQESTLLRAELDQTKADAEQLKLDGEELMMYFNDADPAYRILAMKLLRANYQQNQAWKSPIQGANHPHFCRARCGKPARLIK